MLTRPMSPYAVQKLTNEHYAALYGQLYGLQAVCLRYFNVYGPRQDPDSPYAAVIPLFFRSVLDGIPPVIYGDGEQSRDFTFIDDVTEANIRAAQSDVTGVFNLGNSQRITINFLTESIIRLAGKNGIKPVYKDPRPGDILHSLADFSKARSFGYVPEFNLQEGLKATLAAFSAV